jgi:hypothetical protein
MTALILTAGLSIEEVQPSIVSVDEPYDQLLAAAPETSAPVAADEAAVIQARAILTLEATDVIPVPVELQLQLLDSIGAP